MGLCEATQQGGIFVQPHASTSLGSVQWDATDPGSAGYLSWSPPTRLSVKTETTSTVVSGLRLHSISPLIGLFTNRTATRDAALQVNEGFR